MVKGVYCPWGKAVFRVDSLFFSSSATICRLCSFSGPQCPDLNSLVVYWGFVYRVMIFMLLVGHLLHNSRSFYTDHLYTLCGLTVSIRGFGGVVVVVLPKCLSSVFVGVTP